LLESPFAGRWWEGLVIDSDPPQRGNCSSTRNSCPFHRARNQSLTNSALITKNEKPDSDRGGEDIIKRIHENKDCYERDWPDGSDPKGEIKTKFRGEVKTYRPCENPYQCTNL
jgi:hypothetical protein